MNDSRSLFFVPVLDVLSVLIVLEVVIVVCSFLFTERDQDMPDIMDQSIVVFLILLIASWFNFFIRPYKNDPSSPPLYGWEVGGAFLCFLGIATIVVPASLMIWVFLQKGLWTLPDFLMADASFQGLLNVASILSVSIGLLLYSLGLRTEAQRAVWGNRARGIKNVLHDFFMGASTWLICYPLVALLAQLIARFEPSDQEQTAVKALRMTTETPLLFAFTALLVVFLVPIAEEMLFRGFLQTWLRQKLGWRYAILVTSLIFALFHYSSAQGTANLTLLSSLFILSCFLGFLYERQGSLWASIALHMMFNGISVLILMESMQGPA